MDKSRAIAISVILVSFFIGIYLYPKMPAEMASHWDTKGQVNGYLPKFWGLFLMPLISVALLSLLISIPAMDPLRKNIKKFRDYYEWFIAALILFLFYIYILTILWNTGIRFSIGRFLAPAFGVLLYYCGVLIANSKRNWFIGIRTPWTLSSEKVWDKTHKIGGKMFKIAGIISLLGVFFKDIAFFLVIIPVIAIVVYTIAYSYLEYKKIRVY